MTKKYFLLLLAIMFFTGSQIKSQWNLVPGLPVQEFSNIYLCNDTLYAGSVNRIYISGDGGTSWKQTAILKDGVDFISTILKIDNRIFAGTYKEGIFTSSDNGISWLPFNNGLTSLGASDIQQLTRRGDSLYAGTIGASIYTIALNGNSWSEFNINIPLNNAGDVLSLYNYGGRLITGSGLNANIYYNDQGQSNWNEIHFANFNPAGTGMLAITDLDFTLYGIGSQGFHRSFDEGITWDSFDPGIVLIENGTLVVDNETIYAMLAKATGTYYYKFSFTDNKWILIDHQPGVITYNFVISSNRIFASTLNGLYFRNLDATSTEDRKEIPTAFRLEQNYPNPFNPTTIIDYRLAVNSMVSLKVFDVLGNEITTLVNEVKQPGNYKVSFNAQRTTFKQPLSSGIYFYQLRADDLVSTKKMILLR